MNELMQALYTYLIDYQLEDYYGQTEYEARRKKRDQIGRQLWEQLGPEQRELLEALQRAYDCTQLSELEAMFLASFDQCKALALTHTAP